MEFGKSLNRNKKNISDNVYVASTQTLNECQLPPFLFEKKRKENLENEEWKKLLTNELDWMKFFYNLYHQSQQQHKYKNFFTRHKSTYSTL